jgi:uncharacterized protein
MAFAAYARRMSATDPGWAILRQIDDVPPVPWSNGAGTTRELVGYAESPAWSPGAARWRLSIAVLERPGAFSALPGVDRTFLLVGGDAALSIDGVVHRLGHGDTMRFSGDQEVALESATRGCHAVNLMVERGSGPDAPRLVRGLDPGARLAVVLASTAEVAQFDLLARADAVDAGLRVQRPADAASLVF